MSPRADRIARRALLCLAAGSALVMLLVIGFLLREALPALRDIGLAPLVTDRGWHPHADAAQGRFNLLPMVVGSLLVTLGALLIATPLGLLSAVYLREHAPPRLAPLLRRLVELLAGIPSVVFGLWGLVVLVPLIRAWAPPGASLLAGALIVALMILPTVALLSDAALAAVPRAHRQAAAALGLGTASTVWGVLLPAARAGIGGAVLLAFARAIGETMAVLMVAGNVVQWPHSVFDPVRTLTANIALEMAYALGDHRAALFAAGLALTAVVAAAVLAAERLRPAPRHA